MANRASQELDYKKLTQFCWVLADSIACERAGGSPLGTIRLMMNREDVAKDDCWLWLERQYVKQYGHSSSHGKEQRDEKRRRKRQKKALKKLNAPYTPPRRVKKSKKKDRKDFYNSPEWRAVRYAALKLYGAMCQCCGATRKDGKIMHVDHIKPRSTHPHLELEITNLQVLCEDCNLGKSNRDSTDWR